MANRRPVGSAIALGVALGGYGVLAIAPVRAAVSLANCDDVIHLQSNEGGEVHLGKNAAAPSELSDVHIWRCDASIEAHRASTNQLDFQDATWTFEGDVRIDVGQPQGSLRSDKAIVTFRDNQIEVATITGSPARFEQKSGDVTTRGGARKIDYERVSEDVRLIDDAWLNDGGRTDLKAAVVVYNLKTGGAKASGNKSTGKRFEMTIDPTVPARKIEKHSAAPPPEQSAAGGGVTAMPSGP